ncbi:MAG: hypothetical protein HOY75_02785 [Streptomyces sp.]|nr:hypothetical protein [Streptomyces sp.]
MARRHTTGWEVLGFANDPTPGDPEAIRTLARTYRELGDGAGEAHDLLRGDGAIRQGTGKTMDALRSRITKDLPGLLEKTRDSFQRASEAYNTYADTLTTAQDMLDRAIDQGQEVAATAKSEVPALAPDATADQVAAHNTQQGEVDAAKERLSAAEALGRDAERLREDGSRRASVILDDAAEQAIPARDFIKQFGDFLADNPIIEIIAGIVVGIISVFFPVVGVLLGAALFAVSLIRMASQGKFDVGDIVIGVLTLVPGGVLLGALGKVGASVAKLAKVAPLLAKLGKGAGSISAAVTQLVKGSTFIRKVIDPLGKGLKGLAVSPGLALAGKVAVDVSTEIVLGFTAAAITAKADGKDFEAGPAIIGTLIGAATGGVLAAFGGTKFANSVKDAFTTKGKFKSNIDKAFSKQSLGFVDGTFKASNILFVDGKGQPQKAGFHGINSSTGSDPSTGVVKTTVTTPDGTKTEAKIDPGSPKTEPGAFGDGALPLGADFPVSTKTTTPDGFTSETTDGTNTITSPAGDKITSNGTTTTVETPVSGPGAISTTLGPDGAFKTSGSFGAVTKQPDGTTTFSAPGADGAGARPQFTVHNNQISTPGGTSVVNGPDFTTVKGGGISVTDQNGTTSVFNTPNPPNGTPPVVSHTPLTGNIDVDLGNNTTIGVDAGVLGHQATLPGGAAVGVDQVGNVTVTGGGGQGVTVPPLNAGGPVTVADANVTTTIPQNGGATITAPGGPTTTLGADGFTVNTGGPGPSTVQFSGGEGTLSVTPPGGHPPVTVAPDGAVSVGAFKTDPIGGGTVTDGATSVDFSPANVTFTSPDGSSFGVNPNGRFDIGGIHNAPDGTLTSGSTTVNKDGSASIAHGGRQFDVSPGGQITVTPFGGAPGTAGAPQPTPGNPVTLGNTTIAVDGTGQHTVTVTGTGGTTATVANGTTTVNTATVQVSHGPNGLSAATTGPNPIQVTHGPDGITTVTHGGTTVSTGEHAPTTVGRPGPGQQPAVSVTPAKGATPTQVTAGDSTSTLTPGGATTDVAGANAATGTVGDDGSVTTVAPAGGNTTVTHGPNGTTASDNHGTFSVDNSGTVTDGTVTIKPNTDAANTPVADITNPQEGGGQAQLGTNGVTSQGLTTTVNADGGITVTNQPGTLTTTSAANGTITAQGPDGAVVETGSSFTKHGNNGLEFTPGNTTITGPGGGVITSDGQTVTHTNDGFTTTLSHDQNGQTTSTVHDSSGVGHSIGPGGQATVQNSPSGATITGSNSQVTVVTPQQEGWGLFGSPDMTGGQNTLANSDVNGPTITTQGADPIAEPGSVVHHQGPDGGFSVTYGPAQGTFAPGGVTGLGPSGTFNDPATNGPIDTAGNPLGNGPGQTSISTVHGDGAGGIEVPTPGGGPVLKHEGFFGGKTTVETGNVTITKTPGSYENAGTAGQKSGVLDGPENPLAPADRPGPETFTVGGGAGGGPSVAIPVEGKGGSMVHGGPFDVKSTGKGTFEVSVPGGGVGPADTVTIGKDGTLTGPGVITPPAQDGVAPPPHATLSNGTTITVDGAGPVVTPPGGNGPTSTFNNGTATTQDVGSGVTITQTPGGTATFNSNAGGENTTLTVENGGVEGTVVKTDDQGNQNTFNVHTGDSGAVKVKDAGGKTLSELDPAGSFNEQHSPAHAYYSYTGDPTPTSDYRGYAYEGVTSALKGVVSQVVSGIYEVGHNGADLQTTVENAGIKIGHGVGNSLAGKKLENDTVFKTKGPEVIYTSIPTKTLGALNANADTALANPPEDAPIEV